MATPHCPPADLRADLVARGILSATANWRAQTSGRTNRVWRVDGPVPMAVKFYDTEAQTALFPNDPDSEWRALLRLSGTGLAPEPIARRLSPFPYLVYRYVDGVTPMADAAEICRALRRLHRIPPPDRIRQLPTTVPMVFLHGDPVPGNLVATPQGPCFIDWQCPAVGDPVHDLALALSPSMRIANGLTALTEAEISVALHAYDCSESTDRFHAQRAGFARTLADHAAWRVACGDQAYAAGLRAERAIANQMR